MKHNNNNNNTNNSTTNNSGTTGGTTTGGSTGNSGGGGSGYTEPSYDVVTGNAIVDRAYSWVGKAEYSMGACSPGLFDCSGFVAYCLTGQYQRLGNTFTFLGWPQVSDPQPGDVCVNAQHCGIYIGNGQMIHAADYGIGVIIGRSRNMGFTGGQVIAENMNQRVEQIFRVAGLNKLITVIPSKEKEEV